jgi:hypothetical protein
MTRDEPEHLTLTGTIGNPVAVTLALLTSFPALVNSVNSLALIWAILFAINYNT